MATQPDLDNITGTGPAQETDRQGGRLPEDELEFWWTETRPYDPDWVAYAHQVLQQRGGTINGNPWSAHTAAKIVAEAFQVRIEPGQHLWCYDPQHAHFVSDQNGRVSALIQRGVKWLIRCWSPTDSRGKPTGYSPQKASQVLHHLSIEHPSPKNPAVPANPYLIGFRNGVINIQDPTLTLKKHHPDNGLIRVIPHDYNPEATAPKHSEQVQRLITNPKEANLYQQGCGSAISNLPPPQQMIVLVGKGGRGKSQLLEVPRLIIGEQHCVSLSPRDLGSSIFIKGQLRNKAANLPNDLSQMSSDDTAPFKEALGGDLMTAQVKYSNAPQQFRNAATWIAATNDLPNPGIDATDGFYRRWLPINATGLPITQEIAEYGKLLVAEEAEGIINWYLTGLRQYIKQGNLYDIPATVVAYRATWRDRGSPAAGFVTAYITEQPGAFLTRTQLARHWETYLNHDYKEDAKNRPDIRGLYKLIRQRYPEQAAGEISAGKDSDHRGFPDLTITEPEPAHEPDTTTTTEAEDDFGW